MNRRLLYWVLGGVVVVVLLALAGRYTDLLGTTVFKGGTRQFAYRNQQATVLFSKSSRPMKLELCEDKSRTRQLGYADFKNCRPLNYVVGPGVTSAEVRIPGNFPLGSAVVITRERGVDGTLIAQSPIKEIALFIKVSIVAVIPESGGGGSGGGNGSGGGGGGEEPSAPARISPVWVCIDPSPFGVSVGWKRPAVEPPNSILNYRLSGESGWSYPFVGDYYTDPDGIHRSAFVLSGQLQPDQEFEISILTTGEPEDNNIFRFNAGGLPTPNEQGQPACTFRELYP